MAAGYDGSIRIDTRMDTKGFNKGVKAITGAIKGVALAMGVAMGITALIRWGKTAVDTAAQTEAAWIGLRSIVDGTGKSFVTAKEFLEEYISDGLVPMTNAITAYKNLMMRGYDTGQIEQTLTALKNASAFGRQASLTMGEAVQSATEGLKNENSILVDNSGVTKNVTIMWKEYAESIGTTVGNLTKQQKIQAEVNGIMNETRFQSGDAAKLADTYSGKVSALSTSFYNLRVAVGSAVIPLLSAVIPYIKKAVDWLVIFFNQAGQFIAALFGVKMEKAAQAIDSVTDSTADAAAAQGSLAKNTKKAGEAAKGALAAFDELNVLQLEEGSADAGVGGGAGAGGSGGGLGAGVSQELVPLAENAFNIDFAQLSQNISEGVIAALGKAREAVQNFDFKSIGTDIATLINNIDWSEIFGQTAGLLSDVLKGQLDFLIGFVQELDWAKLGTEIWDAIVAMAEEIDWGGIISKIFELLGSALAGLTTLIVSFASEMWKSFKENVIGYFEEKIEEAGGDVWQGFLDGISEIMVKVDTWIYENIVMPFIEGFKNAFGIQSPSKLMAEQGQYIIEGLKDGILNAWASVGEWIKTEIVEPLKAWFKGTGEEISDSFSVAWTSIKNVWIDVVSWFQVNIIDPVTKAWDTATGNIEGFFTDTFDAVKNTVKGVINEIIDFMNNMISGIVDGINNVIALANDIPGVNINMITAPKIPKLATGAVIPPNAAFAAILGDQRHGTNIEAPEDLIRQIVREETGGGQAVTINFAGNMGALVRAMKPYIDKENTRIGKSLVRGATT